MTGQEWTGQDMTGHDRNEQDRTAQARGDRSEKIAKDMTGKRGTRWYKS